MSKALRGVYEPGRWLLVAGVVLSFALMLQLYTINETVDVTSVDALLGRNMAGLMMVASYLLTTVAMLIVVSEFFQTRKRIEGLMALTDLIDRVEELQAGLAAPSRGAIRVSAPEPQPVPTVRVVAQAEEQPLEAVAPQQKATSAPDPEAIQQLNVAAPAAETKSDSPSYRTIEVKLDGDAQPGAEPQPEEELDFEEMDSVSQTRFLGGDDEQEKVNELLKHSEVIATLNELERVVAELKSKKGTYGPH